MPLEAAQGDCHLPFKQEPIQARGFESRQGYQLEGDSHGVRQLTTSKKDWELARELLGNNDKASVRLIKKLRKKGVEVIDESGGWVAVALPHSDELALMMPAEYMGL